MYNRHLSKLLHLILFIIFVSSLAFAQEVNDDSDENKPEPEEKVLFSPKLEWDEPEIKPTKNKKVQHVTLYGYTEEGVKVLVGKQILWVQASAKTGRKRVRKISIKKLKIKGQKYIDLKPDGSFKINLRLPLGEVQIPVGLIKGKQKARYQIALFVQ